MVALFVICLSTAYSVALIIEGEWQIINTNEQRVNEHRVGFPLVMGTNSLFISDYDL